MKEGPHRLPASQASTLLPRCSHSESTGILSHLVIDRAKKPRSMASCCSGQPWPAKGSSHGPRSHQEVCPWHLSAPYLGFSGGL